MSQSTFMHDHTLPSLPIPELSDTCQTLKGLIHPLVSDDTYEKSLAAIDALAVQGEPLQALLQQAAEKNAGNASWLRPIWDDMYLGFREMLPVNMNYCFQFTNHWGENSLSVFLSALAQTITRMRTESLPPEPARDAYLSMDTLAYMLHTRIPGKVKDLWFFPPLSAPMTASVLCRGQFFILSLMDTDGTVLSPASLSQALADIRKQAVDMPAESAGVGIMSCFDRPNAAELRDMLLMHPKNRFSLARIEKSIVTICLDEASDENFNKRLIAGATPNRFYDKSLQIISDGTHFGVNIEHSSCDAGIWVYLFNQVDACAQSQAVSTSDAAAHILPLDFCIADATREKLNQTAQRYQSVADQISAADCVIPTLSRSNIKALGCSPDALVQQLYQAAYYSLTGQFRSVYEAVATRGYYEGRTECVRPVTDASTAFVRALYADTDSATLSQLFDDAIAAHGDRVKRAQHALGAERHMAGLSMMAQIENLPLPDILSDLGYKTLRHDALSTSSTTAPYIDFFSFGPVVDDGIGIGYGIRNDGLHLAVSAYGNSHITPETFIAELEKAAAMIIKLRSAD